MFSICLGVGHTGVFIWFMKIHQALHITITLFLHVTLQLKISVIKENQPKEEKKKERSRKEEEIY